MTWSKRLFDLLCSTVGLAILWPVFVLVGLLIKLDDHGPVFFLQERVGHKGKRFHIIKFRTMAIDAERKGSSLTVGRDPRITRVGHWLRRTKLDELPQLMNVFNGTMSLVGPRPETPGWVELYTAEQRPVLNLVPGITDAASIRYRHESELLGQAADPEKTYREQIQPDKIRLSLEYAAQANVWTDFILIVRTISGAD